MMIPTHNKTKAFNVEAQNKSFMAARFKKSLQISLSRKSMQQMAARSDSELAQRL